ncbi:MAG: alpha-glucan phosphorylase, partial [Kiritimatiellae bacterium]|nr:alpha-glucan phosphorylase [Kiritimatiellia bacterium]
MSLKKEELMELIQGKLRRHFGREVSGATPTQMFKACALVLRDLMNAHRLETREQVQSQGLRQIHYLSLEFLVGRSLMKNASNLGILGEL